jgi:membrane protease YdiL (CAAX protease family)
MTDPRTQLAPGGGRVRAWVEDHPVAAYVVLAYLVSWTLWSPAVLGLGGPLAAVTFFLGVLGPAAAAYVVLRVTGRPLRPWLASVVRWRVPVRYYLYALGLPALLLAVVDVVLVALGHGIDLGLLPGRLPDYLASFLLVLTVGGAMEEPGWRGFALPRLQEQHSPLVATLILGAVWGLWHLPLYGPGFLGPMFFAVFYTWLWNRTGSVLLCILLHASFTPALDHLVLTEDSAVVDLTILGTLLAGALVLVALTRGRLGLPAADTATSRPDPR